MYRISKVNGKYDAVANGFARDKRMSELKNWSDISYFPMFKNVIIVDSESPQMFKIEMEHQGLYFNLIAWVNGELKFNGDKCNKFYLTTPNYAIEYELGKGWFQILPCESQTVKLTVDKAFEMNDLSNELKLVDVGADVSTAGVTIEGFLWNDAADKFVDVVDVNNGC